MFGYCLSALESADLRVWTSSIEGWEGRVVVFRGAETRSPRIIPNSFDHETGFASTSVIALGGDESGALLVIGHPDADRNGQDSGSLLVYDVATCRQVAVAHGQEAGRGLGFELCALKALRPTDPFCVASAGKSAIAFALQ